MNLFKPKVRVPEQPKTQRGMIDMIWRAVFNDIPHELKWQDRKMSFVLWALAGVIGLMSVVVTILVVFLQHVVN